MMLPLLLVTVTAGLVLPQELERGWSDSADLQSIDTIAMCNLSAPQADFPEIDIPDLMRAAADDLRRGDMAVSLECGAISDAVVTIDVHPIYREGETVFARLMLQVMEPVVIRGHKREALASTLQVWDVLRTSRGEMRTDLDSAIHTVTQYVIMNRRRTVPLARPQ